MCNWNDVKFGVEHIVNDKILTKRELIAIRVMEKMIGFYPVRDFRDTAERAVGFADALLAKLGENND